MREWPVLEVGEDLFDDRVLTVHRFGLVDDQRVRGVEGVVAMGGRLPGVEGA